MEQTDGCEGYLGLGMDSLALCLVDIALAPVKESSEFIFLRELETSRPSYSLESLHFVCLPF